MDNNLHFHDKLIELRAFEVDELLKLHKYLNHPLLIGRRYIPWGFPDLLPLSKKNIESIYNKWLELEKGFIFAIHNFENHELVGHAHIDWEWDVHSPSLEIVISPPNQRKRYGSSTYNILIEYLFNYTPAFNVNCWIADWNEEGKFFAQYQGFKECGRMRRVGIRQGKYYDLVVMDLLRDEWEKNLEDQ